MLVARWVAADRDSIWNQIGTLGAGVAISLLRGTLIEQTGANIPVMIAASCITIRNVT